MSGLDFERTIAMRGDEPSVLVKPELLLPQDHEPAIAVLADEQSFTLILPVPFVLSDHTKSEKIHSNNDLNKPVNKKALEALKEYLEVLIGTPKLAPNKLGGLAVGLVTGRVDRRKYSKATGLYKGTVKEITIKGEDDSDIVVSVMPGITFIRPLTLYNNWHKGDKNWNKNEIGNAPNT